MKNGKIVQVMGPVVDVEFEDNDLPMIKDALTVQNGEKTCVMEVAQHIGNNTVRCIMLSASEGLCKDMEVTPTGAGISVPVGDKTLGRLFNVLGETIDGGRICRTQNIGSSTEIRQALRIRVRSSRYLRQGSRSSTSWRLTQRAVRSVCSEEQVSARQS